jgi:hypothetical protein
MKKLTLYPPAKPTLQDSWQVFKSCENIEIEPSENKEIESFEDAEIESPKIVEIKITEKKKFYIPL